MDVGRMMKLKSVQEDSQNIVVVTTGAKYIMDKTQGSIECWQMINCERLLAKFEMKCRSSFIGFTIDHKDEASCILKSMYGEADNYIRIEINKDSLMYIYSMHSFEIKLEGVFKSQYHTQKNGSMLFIDQIGGIGAYPYKGNVNMEMVNLDQKEWIISYDMSEYSRFFISVFPPREFNYSQSFEDRIYHRSSVTSDGNLSINPVPNDEELEYVRKYANILVLHETIWQGNRLKKGLGISTRKELIEDAAWCCYDRIPFDEKELARTVRKAHSLGMRVIVYMSPFYSTAKGAAYLESVKYVLDKYEVDGIYFDGNSMDIVESYQRVRDVRKILGEKLFYIHCTSDPMNSYNIYCPFIDTYADYILRAEHVTKFSEHYLRYVISGYNISNAIGHICYSGYSPEFVKKLINSSFPNYARFYLEAIDGELESIIKEEYFSRLDNAYKIYLSDKKVIK
ncbi:MAG: hypothetical protein FIA99_17635 [Ruminiclostridium sp.]|nr:hypothetical protein [Ruminiclostridium sp.]